MPRIGRGTRVLCDFLCSAGLLTKSDSHYALTPADLVASSTSGPMKVLDIAAGHGLFGIAIAKRNPRAEIVALDWKAVLAVAEENARAAGLSDRYRTPENRAMIWHPIRSAVS